MEYTSSITIADVPAAPTSEFGGAGLGWGEPQFAAHSFMPTQTRLGKLRTLYKSAQRRIVALEGKLRAAGIDPNAP